MTIDRKGSEPFSLRRWSQRKLAAGRDGPAQAPADSEERRPRDEATARAVSPPEIAPSASGVPPPAAPVHAAASSSPVRASPESALPPIESLTIDSDFSPFMRPGVDESVRRSALRKLLRDPRFNVMDGLDVYIDDYSKPSPIEPEILRTLVQARYLFDPPKTRVNEAGHVEDITETAEERQAASVPAEDAVATPEPGSANPAPKDVES